MNENPEDTDMFLICRGEVAIIESEQTYKEFMANENQLAV